MDYLQHVFSLLSDEDYHLLDHEAYSFLPFLITKMGDPKEPIKSSAKNIANLICRIYPASKVSPYMIEGLKTKNARQRAECLDGLGGLIETYGMSVCQPSPSVCLKEIAKQISDRDNSVRTSALNALVQVNSIIFWIENKINIFILSSEETCKSMSNIFININQ